MTCIDNIIAISDNEVTVLKLLNIDHVKDKKNKTDPPSTYLGAKLQNEILMG